MKHMYQMSMRMGKMFFFMLITNFMLSACSEEDETANQIQLTGGTSTEQTYHADESGQIEGIKFTATAPWTASVKDITPARAENNVVEWLTLSAYSGEAGEHTLNMTLQPNYSGKSRTAQIIIQSGDYRITITVEQTAENEDDTTPIPPKAQIKKVIFTTNILSDPSENESGFEKIFSYDANGKVSRIDTKYQNPGYYDENNRLEITNRTNGKIYFTKTDLEDGNTEEYIATLNGKGQITDLKLMYGDYAFSYDGKTSKLNLIECYNDGENIRLEYNEDGTFRQLKNEDEYSEDDSYEFNFKPEYYTSRYANDGDIDFLGYYFTESDYDFLFYFGLMGQSTTYMPETIPMQNDQWATGHSPYTKPNVTIHKSYTTIEWEYVTACNVDYIFSSGKMSEMTIYNPFKRVSVEYDVVVGNELINPNDPNEGYVYEIKNKKITKGDTEYDEYNIKVEF